MRAKRTRSGIRASIALLGVSSVACQLVVGPIPDAARDAGADSHTDPDTGANGGSAGLYGQGDAGGASSASGGQSNSAGASGAGASGTAGRTGTGGSSGGAGGCCDCDHDGVDAERCGGLDCNDANGAVYTGQMDYSAEAIPGSTGNYDYDCSGYNDKDYPDPLNCGLLAQCDSSVEGYVSTVPQCGGSASFGHCAKNGIGVCQAVTTGDRLMQCR